MGRPCDCFCGGDTFSGGADTGGDPSGDDGGNGIVPAVPVIPSADRLNVGPYKVYLGNKARINVPDQSGSVIAHGDEFIMSFMGVPSVKAFSRGILLISTSEAEKVIAVPGRTESQDYDGNWSVFDYRSVCASGFDNDHPAHADPQEYGVGSNFIQLEGGRITAWRGSVFCHDDDWINTGLNNFRCVDGRTFASSGINLYDDSTEAAYISMGSNEFGSIGRDGVYSGVAGSRVSSWKPKAIEDCVDNQGYPPKSLLLGQKCGAILSFESGGTDTNKGPKLSNNPDTYLCVFGNPNAIGKMHTCYDPEISSPPFGITPPEVLAYQDCVPDGWSTQAFYGSDLIGRESPGGVEFNSQSAFKEIREAYPGFYAVTKHEQPPEAFPDHKNDLAGSTAHSNWPFPGGKSQVSNITACGEIEEGQPGCPIRNPFGRLYLTEAYVRAHYGHHYVPLSWLYHTPTMHPRSIPSQEWAGQNTNSCVVLNMPMGWINLPHRRLNGNTMGHNEYLVQYGGTTYVQDQLHMHALQSLNFSTGRFNLGWTHPEYQFCTSKFVPTFDLVNGIPTGGGTAAPFMDGGFKSSGEYIWIGGAQFGFGGSGTLGSHLQKYPPEIFSPVGIRNTQDPEASGSFIVAIYNNHNVSSPPVGTGVVQEDSGWFVWSGVSDSNYLSSVFLPSGLLNAEIIPDGFDLVYTVYYSGDAITTFGSGWHYRS